MNSRAARALKGARLAKRGIVIDAVAIPIVPTRTSQTKEAARRIAAREAKQGWNTTMKRLANNPADTNAPKPAEVAARRQLSASELRAIDSTKGASAVAFLSAKRSMRGGR